MAAVATPLALTAAAATPVALPPPTGLMTLPADSLSLELVVPDQVRPGAVIRFTLRVRNQAHRPLDLYLRGRTPTMDVIVTGPGGEVVWRRLEDEIIPAIVQLRVLQPGQQLEVTAEWDQRTRAGSRVAPGPYAARGSLLTEGKPLDTPQARFEILAR